MNHKVLLVLAVFISCFFNVSANAMECSVMKDYTYGNAEFSLMSAADDLLTLQILPENIAPEKLWESIPEEKKVTQGNITVAKPVDIMVYSGETNTDADGKSNIKVSIEKSGNFILYVKSLKTGERVGYPFSFTNKNDYLKAIEELNKQIAAGSKDGFYDAIKSNISALDFTSELAEKVDLRAVSDILFASKGSEVFNAEEFERNKSFYILCETAAVLNSGILTSTKDRIDYILGQHAKLSEDYKKYVTADAVDKYLISKCEKKNIKTVDEFTDKFKEALILTAVHNPNGYMNIKDIFERYSDVIGVSGVTGSTSVYSSLAGKEYSSVNELLSAYNRLLASKPSVSGSGSYGGGSSSVNVPIDKVEKAKEIRMPFEDLDTASWAYEAISTLYNKGIISGKSETRYAPNDNITREEFVKLIIGAIGELSVNKQNKFKDVSDDAWFCNCVNLAAELGIVNGIGDNLFGAGMKITRQDMAVMLYKAVVYKGIDLNINGPEFTDSDEISDYAVQAIGALASEGIINGMDDGTFKPNSNATRAEAAQMVFGVMKLMN